MRIITGLYKGRHFDIPRNFKARPTTDFAKENIFNVLNGYIDFDGACALDLFSGTGSITLELLSRGCSQVISVEQDRDHHRFIQQCVAKLNGEDNVLCLRADVFRFLKSCRQQFDFIFADPPYALKELSTIPDLIFRGERCSSRGARYEVRGTRLVFSAELSPTKLSSHLAPRTSHPEIDSSHLVPRTTHHEIDSSHPAPSLLKPDGILVLEHGKDYDFSQHPRFVEHRHYGSVNFSLFR